MPNAPNPVLIYYQDSYDAGRGDLRGRHSAGESFLAAFLAQTQEPEVFALCDGDAAHEQFQRAISNCGRPLQPRAIERRNLDVLRRQAVVYLPDPRVAAEARIRSFLGDHAYAVCGVTHTICSKSVLDSVRDLAVAPVQSWDALICTSRSVHTALSTVLANVEADLAVRVGATRFTRPLMPIIPLGVHAERFTHSNDARSRWRQRLDLSDDTVAILFFGRLSVHSKASPFQLAQAAEMAAGNTRKKLAIIWAGWFDSDFQRRAFMETAKSMAPSVSFHHVDGRDPDVRFSIWSAGDIFCSLSDNIQESFGLTVVEAMAAALPVVISNWNGYREIIQHGINGALIDTYLPDSSFADAAYRYASDRDTYDRYIGAISQVCFVDVAQTAQWIARFAEDVDLRQTFGANGRRAVAENFDWKVVMPRYVELWQEQKERILNARRDPSYVASRAWKILDPAETFAGYPSHVLELETRLAAGPNFARWDALVTEPGIVVNARTLVSQPSFLRLRTFFAGERTTTVAQALAVFPGGERALVRRSIHWLIKIGLLQLVRDRETPPTT